MDNGLNNVREGAFGAAKENCTADQDDQGDGDRKDEERTYKRYVRCLGTQQRPTEASDHAGHGIERQEKAELFRNQGYRVDDRGEVHPDLNDKGNKVIDITEAYVKGREP